MHSLEQYLSKERLVIEKTWKYKQKKKQSLQPFFQGEWVPEKGGGETQAPPGPSGKGKASKVWGRHNHLYILHHSKL